MSIAVIGVLAASSDSASEQASNVHKQSRQFSCPALLQVITISGRTIRKEAQASPTNAEAAITAIEKLLAACPEQDLVRAQDMRKARVNMKAV